MNNLAESNSKKADSERLWELKESLSNYTSLEMFRRAEQSIMECATKDDLDGVRHEIKGKYAYLKTIIDTHSTKEEAKEWIKQLNVQIYKDLTNYHQICDFKRF